MDATEQHELVGAAQRLLRPHRVGDRLFGDVAAIVQTPSGGRFGGVCVDTASGTGFCAEQAALAAMVTAGEYHAAAMVAVWRDEDGRLYVLPPCGSCREFLRQVDPANLDTVVLLGNGRTLPLSELLPEHEWPRPEL
jgi:cytidine deaminase